MALTPGARLLTIAVVLGALVGCSSPLVPLNVLTPETASDRRGNIPFGNDPRQRMDLYRAKDHGDNASTVVFVYGGAWRDGRKEDYAFVAQALAARGHDVLIPDYRLYPRVTWPVFITDVADAIQELDNNAEQWLDRHLGRIVLMGHSSGAHSAAVIAGDVSRWLPDIDAEVVGLIGLSGPCDLPLDNPEVTPVFAGLEDPVLATPVRNADADHPPTLLLHGSDDKRVLPLHTERMAAALDSLSIPHQVNILEGTGHGAAVAEFSFPLDLLNDASEIVGAWLDELDG